MTAGGWKSIDPSATAAENGSLQVARLEPGDSLIAIQRSIWSLAAFSDASIAFENAVGHQILGSLTASTVPPDTVLYNLLLDGNHTYWVIEPDEAPFVQTISDTSGALGEPKRAYLVHNKL